jgi:hypothetical protein
MWSAGGRARPIAGRRAAHRAVTLLVGHVIVASGVLPGYPGVWWAMHLGGRLRIADARRVWAGWAERHETEID